MAHVVERMRACDPYDLHHGMAWDFLCDQPAIWRIVENWREAELSSRITVAVAQRWLESCCEVIGNTDRGALAAKDEEGEEFQYLHVHLTSGWDVWITSERDALNHLRSMLSVAFHDRLMEQWCIVLRRPIAVDQNRRDGRFKASVRFMLVPREHAHRFVDGVERRADAAASAT